MASTVDPSFEQDPSAPFGPPRDCRSRWARVASAGDNAAMPSWHGRLQRNVLGRLAPARPRRAALGGVVFGTDHIYHPRRRQRALGKLTPVEYELAFTTQPAVAA